MAHITYKNIEKYAGLKKNDIKSGLSLLAANGLVHVERVPSNISEHGVANAYRLVHLEPYVHMGTRGRDMNAEDFEHTIFNE